jgi:hypothetical protein
MQCKYYITHVNLVAADDLWHLGTLFCTVHYLECILQIYFGTLWNKAPHTDQLQISCTWTQYLALVTGWAYVTAEFVGLGWSVFVGVAFQPRNICWSRQPSLGWGDLDFFQLLGSNSSPERVWNLGVYILPHTKITEFNCWELSDPEGGKTIFMVHLKVCQLME